MNHCQKFPAIFALVFALLAAVLLAPTAVDAARPSVSADKKSFDLASGSYFLEGNVRVTVGSRIITADRAKVSLFTQEVWGEGNILLVSEEDAITFSGGSVYVNGGERTAYVAKRADFRQGELQITANEASYNWQTKIASFSKKVVIIEAGKKRKASQVGYNVVERRFL